MPGITGPAPAIAPLKFPGQPKIPALSGNQGTTAAMPLDEASQIALQQAAAARTTFMSNLQQQQQAEEQNYGQSLYDLHQQHPTDVNNLLNNYAARGMAFSSGYGDSVGQLANTYGTNLSRLAAARAQALSGFGLQRNNYNNEYGLDLSSIRQAAADRLSSAAGTLGLGSTTNPAQLTQLLQGQAVG